MWGKLDQQTLVSSSKRAKDRDVERLPDVLGELWITGWYDMPPPQRVQEH